MFDRIIDAQFEGAVTLNRCWAEGNYCYLDINVHMSVVYCQDQEVTRRSEKFAMVVCRNKNRPVDYGFSIKRSAAKAAEPALTLPKKGTAPTAAAAMS